MASRMNFGWSEFLIRLYGQTNPDNWLTQLSVFLNPSDCAELCWDITAWHETAHNSNQNICLNAYRWIAERWRVLPSRNRDLPVNIEALKNWISKDLHQEIHISDVKSIAIVILEVVVFHSPDAPFVPHITWKNHVGNSGYFASFANGTDIHFTCDPSNFLNSMMKMLIDSDYEKILGLKNQSINSEWLPEDTNLKFEIPGTLPKCSASSFVALRCAANFLEDPDTSMTAEKLKVLVRHGR